MKLPPAELDYSFWIGPSKKEEYIEARVHMNQGPWKSVFAIATDCALAGMFMSGLFGLAAGKLTPDFFRHVIPWRDGGLVGFATFLGATVGVVFGGGLGCFGILIQGVFQWRKRDRPLE